MIRLRTDLRPTADPRLADNGSVAATPTQNATTRADAGHIAVV